MKYSDEISKLAKLAVEQRNSGKVDPVTEELIEGLLTLVKNLASDCANLDKRLKQSEEFAETLSMDLFDIQSLILKNMNAEKADDLTGIDLGQYFAQMNESDDDDEEDHCDCGCDHEHHHHHHAEEVFEDEEYDEEGSTFIRCPFCNTLIFGDTSAHNFQCPFCGGNFTKDDIF